MSNFHNTVLAALLFGAVGLEGKEILPASIEQMYFPPETVHCLTFKTSSDLAGRRIVCEIRDFTGKTLETLPLAGNAETRTLSLNRPRGFYELHFPETKQTYGISVLADFTGEKDPFFGLEPLLSPLPDKVLHPCMRVLNRRGVAAFREYHPWMKEERKKGQFNRTRDRIYRIAAQNGMKGICFFGEAPAWAASPNGRDPDPLLFEASLLGMVHSRANGLNAFQFGNEPNLQRRPADGYLAYLAASSRLFKQNKIDLPVAAAGISSFNLNPLVLDGYFNGGILNYCDIFTFHTYTTPEKLEGHLALLREYMQKTGKPSFPIWITECGKAWPRGVGNIKRNSKVRGISRPPAADALTSAMFITAKGAIAKAGGVQAYYPFAMRFFEEGSGNFGMVDRHWTPLLHLHAYFEQIRLLAGKTFRGELAELPAGARNALCFSDDRTGQTVVVLYTGNSGKSSLTLRHLPCKALLAVDGSPLEIGSDVSIHGGIAYALLPQIPALKKDSRLLRLANTARLPLKHERRAEPLVFMFASETVAKSNQSSAFYIGAPRTFKARLYNLSGKTMRAEPVLELPDAVTADAAQEKYITLEPRSCRELEWTLRTESYRGELLTLTLRDRAGNAASCRTTFFLLENCTGKTLRLNRADAWRANSSGKCTISQQGDAVQFRTDFTDGNFWTYPEYELALPRESLLNAIAVSFEISAEQNEHCTDWQNCYVQLAYPDGEWFGTAYPPPGKNGSRRLVELPWVELERIAKIRIGASPVKNGCTIRLKNIRVHYFNRPQER